MIDKHFRKIFVTCLVLIFHNLFSINVAFCKDIITVDEIKNALLPTRKTKAVINKPRPIDKPPSVTMHLHFKTNSYELTQYTIKQLSNLGKALQNKELRQYIYQIEGHTDSQGDASYNQVLSEKRAAEVANYLITYYSISPEQFEVVGFGEARPVASNATEKDRSLNRRVVIINTLRKSGLVEEGKTKIHVKIVKYSSNATRGHYSLQDGDVLTSNDNYAIELIPVSKTFAYVFQVDTGGKYIKLFPNPSFTELKNPLEAGELVRIPTPEKWLFLDERRGREEIIVIGQNSPLPRPELTCKQVNELNSMHASGPRTRTKGPGGTRPPKKEKYEAVDINTIFYWKRYFMHE